MRRIFYGLCALVCLFSLVGCSSKDAKIVAYTRDTSSGTRDGFFTTIGYKDAIKDNTKLVSGYVEYSSNQEIVTAVGNDEYGIGYISLASLADSAKLKALKYEGVEASEASVLDSTYKLTRNFNYITRAEFATEKEDKIVKAFIAYLSTQEGMATIKSKDGIISIGSSAPTWKSIKADHPVCSEDNSSVTIRFGGSTSVDKMSKALSAEFSKLCGNFVADHNHTGSSDAFKRTQGSEKDGANKLHIGFASREFSSTEASASNTTGKICVDAIVAVVNKANSYSNTNAASLKEIYSGEKTKWSELE